MILKLQLWGLYKDATKGTKTNPPPKPEYPCIIAQNIEIIIATRRVWSINIAIRSVMEFSIRFYT